MVSSSRTDNSHHSTCRKVTTAAISHIGLFLVVAIYCVLGAYLFINLESKQETLNNQMKKKVALDIRDSRNYILNDMWYQNSLNHSAPQFKALAMNNLKQFHDFVVSGVMNNNYDGTIDGEVHDWTFMSTLLFTFTTIAAIGYGHISPKTFNGQIFCIFYGLVGVPLLLVFLANIGDPLARAFRYAYSRGCCVVCRVTRRKTEMKKGQKPVSVFKDEVGNEVYMPTNEVQVPITVTVCFLSFYLMVGGILFTFTEGWQFYESAYFSFITLSTIGFGDLVPGNSFDIEKGGLFMALIKMSATIFFSLFGMALLSMCINLIQEQIVNKFKWMAKELGMNSSKNSDENKAAQNYRFVNADGSVTVTPPEKDGNKGFNLQDVEDAKKKGLPNKFRRRQTEHEFDDLAEIEE